MPDFVEKEAKTVDEAIQLALDELNIELEDADVEILEEGSKAKLGIFGGKGAKVRVTVNIPDTNQLYRKSSREQKQRGIQARLHRCGELQKT